MSTVKTYTTYANLTIDKIKGQEFIPYVELELEQFIADHARVKIKIDLESFGENVLPNPMERVALINEKLHIDVMIDEGKSDDIKTTNVYTFLGLITDVQIELAAGHHGWIYIYAASRSIELERGKILRTHTDMKLKKIVERVTEHAANVQISNDPEYTDTIPFSMQYHETDYQYLKRLAWMYGEKLVFDGNRLIFGKIPNENTTRLTYYKDLMEIRLNSRLIANKFKYYYHNIKEEKVPEEKDINEQSTFTEMSGVQSNKLNLTDHMPEIPIATPVYNDGSLKKLTEIHKKTELNRMFYVSGSVNLYKVTIADLLEIDFDKDMTVYESLGTLRVTHVLHKFDQNKRYQCTFDACQKKHDYFPYENMEMPNAQPLHATIKSNNDPEGIGRVQVVFDFETDMCQHWMKCVTPDGGGNSAIGIAKNRGMNFIPEEKDRIIVSFFEGNPDKPYVSGSLFTGSSASGQGGGAGNHAKYLRDKSGTEVVLNDKAGSIHIKDKNGSDSQITLDGAGNITMESWEKIELICKPKEGGNGSSIVMDKDGQITIKGKFLEGNMDKEIVLIARENLYMIVEELLQSWAKTCTIIGKEQTNLMGGGGRIVEENGDVFIN